LRYLSALLLLATACAAQTVTSPSKAEWTATPGFVRQSSGKYPSTLNLVLYKNDCRDSSGQLQDKNKLASGSTYEIVPTGTGVTTDTPTIGDCTLTVKLTIDASAQSGFQFLMVNEKPDPSKPSTSSRGFAVFAMMDATAGATPGSPEVDVIWDVVSKHVCADSFGKHVPESLYCIELKLGNNSGHSLQLAGVGFKIRHPFAGKAGISPDASLVSANTAYQTTRSMAQAGGDISSRNMAYKALEATGLIMASFTPFFKNTNHKANWSTASSIVSGALVQGFALIWPDNTVRELTNLDDQAFRDGKLINNNQQVRMMVFVDKELIRGQMKQRCTQLLTPAPKTPGGSSDSPDASDLKKCQNSDDPTIVKVLLGDLVIVGDKLDYEGRMVVDTGVTSQEVTPALSASATMDTGSGTVTVTGASLSGVTVTMGNAAQTLTSQTPTQLQFTVDTKTKTPFDIQLKSADGKQTQKVTVQAAPK
jgi:hypothetical protein